MNDLVEGCRITGSVRLDQEDIYGNMDINVLRKRVGMVFQKPNPFPMSVYDNIAYGPRTHGIRNARRNWMKSWRHPFVRRRSGTNSKTRLEKECAWTFRWTAAASLHRKSPCRRSGSYLEWMSRHRRWIRFLRQRLRILRLN